MFPIPTLGVICRTVWAVVPLWFLSGQLLALVLPLEVNGLFSIVGSELSLVAIFEPGKRPRKHQSQVCCCIGTPGFGQISMNFIF